MGCISKIRPSVNAFLPIYGCRLDLFIFVTIPEMLFATSHLKNSLMIVDTFTGMDTSILEIFRNEIRYAQRKSSEKLFLLRNRPGVEYFWSVYVRH